ncbi:hypothetical protein BKA80DRAFT_61432 [Phyllosticta citrichinensis]
MATERRRQAPMHVVWWWWRRTEKSRSDPHDPTIPSTRMTGKSGHGYEEGEEKMNAAAVVVMSGGKELWGVLSLVDFHSLPLRVHCFASTTVIVDTESQELLFMASSCIILRISERRDELTQYKRCLAFLSANCVAAFPQPSSSPPPSTQYKRVS